MCAFRSAAAGTAALALATRVLAISGFAQRCFNLVLSWWNEVTRTLSPCLSWRRQAGFRFHRRRPLRDRFKIGGSS